MFHPEAERDHRSYPTPSGQSELRQVAVRVSVVWEMASVVWEMVSVESEKV